MMKRRSFLKQTGLFAFVVGGNPSALLSIPARWGSALPPLVCPPTTNDILGPFYRANAPFRSDLTLPDDPGTVFTLRGKVISSNCPAPLSAVVDIWQADHAGAYDNNSPDYNYRGRQNTDAEGDYEFITIVPGRYLNGSQYRPSHIHFRVTAPGHVELITQLYFQGDPFIPIDPWASDPDAVLRILPIVDDVLNFEIILNALPSSTGSLDDPQIIRLYRKGPDEMLVHAEGTLLRAVEMFAANGDLVRTAYHLQSPETLFSVNGLAAGIYFIRAKTDSGIFVEKWVK